MKFEIVERLKSVKKSESNVCRIGDIESVF